MIIKLLAATSIVFVASSPAAATVMYKFTQTGSYSFSFLAPESPAGTSDFIDGPSAIGFSSVSGIFEGVATSEFVTFSVGDSGVGVRALNQSPIWQGFSISAGQMFTGTTRDPTFKLGVYPLVRATGFGPGYPGDAVLTISAVPEPATWAILLFGMAGVGAAERWRLRGRSVAIG
jgi:hypothetical protein